LLVSRPKVAGQERTWPGRVFEREDMGYTEALEQFVASRLAQRAEKDKLKSIDGEGIGDQKAQKLALRTDIQRLQVARRQERERRQLTDRAWKARQQEHREVVLALKEGKHGSRSRTGRKRGALKAQRRAEWAERHRELARRREEDERWRQERESIRQRQQEFGATLVSAWIAVLVVVDNCTRRSLGLPLFTMGAHVTAELVVEALAAILPRELKYLIADGAAMFSGEAMKTLASGRGFVRVPLAKHRPQSNGIAERFIGTLKAWLAGKDWECAEALARLLEEFLEYYNDRPHQGRELAGLSPNEYAARKAAV
jgi:transposase InsO family protein